MEIFDRKHDGESHEIEAIRGSTFLLTIKIIAILFAIELIYAGIDYVLSIGLAVPFDLHHHVSLLLLALDVIKVFIQIVMVVGTTLTWANTLYYITDKHIVKRVGMVQTKENIYHFDNIRSISVDQSILGKLFNYGDITIKTSASGGYQGDIILFQIDNPHKYKTILKNIF